ncbi:MAG: Brp/Blh family beta-carotene 15,15'-dioxygenase [Pacificimonas sp.]
MALAAILILALATLTTWVPGAVYPAALALFLFGTPHGAVMFRGGRAVLPSVSYAGLYVGSAFGMAALFLVAPGMGLIGFFAISAIHFARAEADVHPAYGVFATFAAFLFSPERTADLIIAILGDGGLNGDWMLVGGGIAVTALLIALFAPETRRTLEAPSRLALTVAMFAFLHPLLAIALYFFALHSVKEYLDLARDGALRDAMPYGIPAAVGGALLYALTANELLAVSTAALVALAFTLPHMFDELRRAN